MNIAKLLRQSLYALTVACIISGCATPKNVTYFQDAQNVEIIEISEANKQITVQPHDKLSIVVTSKDPVLAQTFNLSVITSRLGQDKAFNGSGSEVRDYSLSTAEGISLFTVSEKGTIDYPILGVIKVEGLTRSELAAFIKGEIVGKNLIKDPIVTVEFQNTGISVMGEVYKPGRYDMNTDILTLPEAIALAGDLTIHGQRQNILVMRRNGNKIENYRVDLTNANKLISSPAYYLKQGDVIYVEPSNMRKRQSTNNGNNVMNVSFWLSVASLLTSAAVLIK